MHLRCIAIDIDHVEDITTTKQQLLELPVPPTTLTWSGSGAHGYWWFPIELMLPPKYLDTLKKIQKDIIAHLKPTLTGIGEIHSPATVLRVPGTINPKNNSHCHIIHQSNPIYPGIIADWMNYPHNTLPYNNQDNENYALEINEYMLKWEDKEFGCKTINNESPEDKKAIQQLLIQTGEWTPWYKYKASSTITQNTTSSKTSSTITQNTTSSAGIKSRRSSKEPN
jgi:hypothetical protein